MPFSGGALSEALKLPRAYPARKRASLFSTTLFDKIYLGIAVYLSAIALGTEYIVTENLKLSFFIMAALAYIYISIRFTIQNFGYFSQKVVMQTIMLTIVAIIGRKLLPRPLFIYEYVLPSLYILAMLTVSVFIVINHRHPQKYLLNLLSIALLGMLPFVVLLFTDSSFKLLSILTASLGGLIVIVTLIFSHKKIKQELIRLFHT
ncbi:MAG TPA: DUF6320 domain-containing protein [Clostridia bacterium]|mgnify:CR=1 FL=1|nr:DUF6320 domain-containing protein [Clostridia bacterium]